MAAVNWLVLTKVVGTPAPPKCTTLPLVKALPLTVNATVVPTSADVGDTVDTAGAGLLTVNVTDDEVPPYGPGVVTDTGTVPATASWNDETVAVRDVGVT